MPDAVDLYDDLEAAESAQCIQPEHLPRADHQPDSSSMRYDLGSDFSSMQQKQQLTDLTLTVDNSSCSWEVHKLVLASSSPFFRKLFEELLGRLLTSLQTSTPLCPISVGAECC